MSTTAAYPNIRQAIFATLAATARAARYVTALRVQARDDAAADAEAWLHRRAARSETDRARYRLGAAFEPGGHLRDLDDLTLTDIDVLGGAAFLLLASLATPDGGETLSDLIVRLQRTPAGRIVRQNGVWARRGWLSVKYRAVVEAFETSEAGRDPEAAWRRNKPTVRQHHLALELARMQELARPAFRTSGIAHDWLRDVGGRFDILRPPPLPPLPTIADLSS